MNKLQVFNIEGTVITDQNAASIYARFFAPNNIGELPLDDIFAESWTNPYQYLEWRQKSQKCAEVLVPNRVSPEYIIGAYVADQNICAKLNDRGFMHPIEINPYLFFR